MRTAWLWRRLCQNRCYDGSRRHFSSDGSSIRELHQPDGYTTQDRKLAARLQPATFARFVELLAARRICTNTSGDERMRKASTRLPEQGTQTPSPAPALIPADTKNHPRTHIGSGTANGGTSTATFSGFLLYELWTPAEDGLFSEPKESRGHIADGHARRPGVEGILRVWCKVPGLKVRQQNRPGRGGRKHQQAWLSMSESCIQWLALMNLGRATSKAAHQDFRRFIVEGNPANHKSQPRGSK